MENITVVCRLHTEGRQYQELFSLEPLGQRLMKVSGRYQCIHISGKRFLQWCERFFNMEGRTSLIYTLGEDIRREFHAHRSLAC